jgi:hypothetical protein
MSHHSFIDSENIMNNTKNLYIYVLKLENDKYYVGKTNNPNIRINDHFVNNGSQWTTLHKPTKIVKIKPNCDSFDEDKYTLKYMSVYGIDNVRGGSFCEIVLNEDKIKMIKHMLTGSTDKCYKCGNEGHFAKDCVRDNKEKAPMIKYTLNNTKYHTNEHKQYVKVNKCERCGRHGHADKECYARTNVYGDRLVSKYYSDLSSDSSDSSYSDSSDSSYSDSYDIIYSNYY